LVEAGMSCPATGRRGPETWRYKKEKDAREGVGDKIRDVRNQVPSDEGERKIYVPPSKTRDETVVEMTGEQSPPGPAAGYVAPIWYIAPGAASITGAMGESRKPSGRPDVASKDGHDHPATMARRSLGTVVPGTRRVLYLGSRGGSAMCVRDHGR
jgi:hypothetical protein